jgi:hypothetical protein
MRGRLRGAFLVLILDFDDLLYYFTNRARDLALEKPNTQNLTPFGQPSFSLVAGSGLSLILWELPYR